MLVAFPDLLYPLSSRVTNILVFVNTIEAKNGAIYWLTTIYFILLPNSMATDY